MPKTDKKKGCQEPQIEAKDTNAAIIAKNDDAVKAETEYERLYGWIHKGDVDATLKAILKELVRIRMGGGHV